jgi:hypothetical protein
LNVNGTRHYEAAIIGAGQGENPLAMVTEDGTNIEVMRITSMSKTEPNRCAFGYGSA